MVDKCITKGSSQNICRFLFILCVICGINAFFAEFVWTQGAVGLADELSKELIVKVRTENHLGAGIIVGVQGDSLLYIITARHIVTDLSTGDAYQDINIGFNFIDGDFVGKYYPQYSNERFDIALLQVSIDGLEDQLRDAEKHLPFHHLQSPEGLNNGVSIYPCGHPGWGEWYIPVAPSRISNVIGEEIQFEPRCDKGYSGGALLDEDGNVVGMILRDHTGFCEAISFDRIRQTLEQEWKIPVAQKSWPPTPSKIGTGVSKIGTGVKVIIGAVIVAGGLAVTYPLIAGDNNDDECEDPPPCDQAQLTQPDGTTIRADASEFPVPSEVPVEWTLKCCQFTVQTYQNDNPVPIRHYEKVQSGTLLNLGDPHSGETELKVWISGTKYVSRWIWIDE